jgi:hypothetical protein
MASLTEACAGGCLDTCLASLHAYRAAILSPLFSIMSRLFANLYMASPAKWACACNPSPSPIEVLVLLGFKLGSPWADLPAKTRRVLF